MQPYIPNLLLLGSAGRFSGKTTLACNIITAMKDRYSIVGLKITTVSSEETGCPRGSEGCGVCKKLETAYELIEETTKSERKDTERLLKAGAKNVYWLKVKKECLYEGFVNVIKKIGPGIVLICESNSLRKYIKPGVFLMLQHIEACSYKTSAKEVKEFADKTILFDGNNFDFNIEKLMVIHNSWTLGEN